VKDNILHAQRDSKGGVALQCATFDRKYSHLSSEPHPQRRFIFVCYYSSRAPSFVRVRTPTHPLRRISYARASVHSTHHCPSTSHAPATPPCFTARYLAFETSINL